MIQGKEREVKEFNKYVGVAEFNVVGFNLTKDQIKAKLGYEPKTEPVYHKVNEVNGEKTDSLNLTIFLKEKTTGEFMRTSIFLEGKSRIASDGKPQYVNEKAMSSYVIDGPDPKKYEWFIKNKFRQAYIGEAELFNFLKNWLSNFDWFSDNDDVRLNLDDTKTLLTGNVNMLNDLAARYSKQTIGLQMGVRIHEGKEYQDVYNKACLPGYSVKKIQDVPRGMSMDQIESQPYAIKQFLKQVEGQYGYQHFCGNSYRFRVYNPEENVLISSSGLVNQEQPTNIKY